MNELTASLRKTVLRIVERVVSLLTKPFSGAPDLESYSQRGYYLLGLLIFVITLALWSQGILSIPLSRSSDTVRVVYKSLSENTAFFKYLPDNFVLVAFLPMMGWVVLSSWKGARHALGELTANVFFWLLNKGLSAGEWCIEHRWYSLTLMGVLSATIAVLATLQIQRITSTRTLENDFNHWLDQVDRFIDSNPLTKSEPDAYEKVHSAWRRDFDKLLARPDGTKHPAACLHEMLDKVYLDRTDQPWIALLQQKGKDLAQIEARCVTPTTARVDPTVARAHALSELMMARIDVRLAEDVDVQPYTSYRELSEALNRFSDIALLDFGEAEYGRLYKSDAYNGQGTVYGNAMSAFLKKTPPLRPDQLASVAAICGTPGECAMRSLTAYRQAAGGWDDCSFQGKRQRNNTTDLLARIGQNYGRLGGSLTGKPFATWTRTPVSLATEIEGHVRDLMACNAREPFFSTFAVTAAQGLAVAAHLRKLAGEDATPELSAAGRYLRLANSFEPANVSKWDVDCYCFAVENGKINPALRDAIASSADGLPDATNVIDVIEKKCP